HLMSDLQSLVNRYWSPRHAVRNRLPFDKLHDEKALAVSALQSVQHRNIRMIQGCENTRLAFKPRDTFIVGSEDLGQDFHTNVSAEPRILREIYLTHSAGSKPVPDFVMRDPFADHDRRDYKPVLVIRGQGITAYRASITAAVWVVTWQWNNHV